MIDFSPVWNGEKTLFDLAPGVTANDLRDWTRESIATLSAIIEQASDAMIVFVPDDPEANDPHAEPEMQHVGWTLGHLVAHVTATSEESAATSSVLARGIAYGSEPRLRWETPWREMDTQAKALARLQESLRMRLGALDMWPDVPHLDVLRQLPPSALARYGQLNATAQFLAGLRHEAGHYAQFREALRQAQAAITV